MAGSKPGERRGGRQKGTTNKRTQELQREVQARTGQATSLHPNSLDELRRTAMVITGLAAEEQRKPAEERDVRLMADLTERAGRMWNMVARYEHSTMAAVTITRPPLDLTKLTDEQLDQLERIYRVASTQHQSDPRREAATHH